jgi:hypothetical protein
MVPTSSLTETRSALARDSRSWSDQSARPRSLRLSDASVIPVARDRSAWIQPLSPARARMLAATCRWVLVVTQ